MQRYALDWPRLYPSEIKTSFKVKTQDVFVYGISWGKGPGNKFNKKEEKKRRKKEGKKKPKTSPLVQAVLIQRVP